jgi:hypothetical protein
MVGSNCVSRAHRISRNRCIDTLTYRHLLEFVSRADAHAAALFIDTSFQRLGLGSLALRLLEQLAVDLFDARVVTLDAAAYHIARSGEFPDWKYVEMAPQESSNSLWYKKLGYEPYGVSKNLNSGSGSGSSSESRLKDEVVARIRLSVQRSLCLHLLVGGLGHPIRGSPHCRTSCRSSRTRATRATNSMRCS